VGDRRSFAAEQFHVGLVQPDAVGHGEVGADEAQLVHVSRQRGAVGAHSGYRLHFRFGHVRVKCKAVLAREVAASDQEFIGAVVRYGRRDGEP